MPKVSIIIPAYNSEKYISETLKSVQDQTLTDWSLIIVNDGSQDNTAHILEKFVRQDERIRVVNQQNSGVADARNRGLAESDASTDYIAFLDHDDVWEMHTLQILVEALEDNSQAIAAYGLARFIDADSNPCLIGEAERWTQNRRTVTGNTNTVCDINAPLTFPMVVRLNPIITPGQVVIRRAAMNIVGGFDSKVAPADDYDLWLRLTCYGDMEVKNEVVLNFRQHLTNASKNYKLMSQSEIRVRKKLLESLNLSEYQRYIATTGSLIWQRDVAELRIKWMKEHIKKAQLVSAIKQMRLAVLSYYRYTRRSYTEIGLHKL